MMKRLSLTILCCLLLSGCIFDPVFDTSSWDAYQNSAAAIKARLSNEDLRRLNIAMRYLLFESAPTLQLDRQSPILENPNFIIARLGPRINGLSAAAIIQNLSIKLDSEIAETEARLPKVENVLGAVEVTSPRYYWQRSGYLEQPVIEFTVRNGGSLPISRIYFSSALTTPGRAIPWVRQQFVQNFKGGLEPREQQQITLQPQDGAWRDPQLKYLPDAELKVVVTNFADASEEKLIAVDSDSLDLKRKVRAALK
ncbi:MAG TPA: DUF6694 family lipoprotein [Candidatus Binataceae bacterium]|jgi:hypothetical protein